MDGERVEDRVIYLPACMAEGEQELLREYLAQASVVLEFGIGGSTGIAAEYPLDQLIGIDSHPDWIAHCHRDPRIAALASEGKVALHHIDIGPVKEWGIPASAAHAAKWRNYSLAVWSKLGAHVPDFVFVDGRFRLSCALQSLLRLPDLKALGFHDFRDRPHYHPILEFTDVIAREGQLVIVAPKPDIDFRKLATVAFDTLFDAR